MEQRQNKRYRLKAFVMFSWQASGGRTLQGEGYTRDISASSVFVLTSDRPTCGTTMKLEVVLPSLREKQAGALLRTQGNVVRSEENGFAVVANMGFRMQIPETSSDARTAMESVNDKQYDSSPGGDTLEEVTPVRMSPRSRFWM